MQAFFETSPAGSAFHGLALGSPGFAQSLRSTLYPLLHWTLRLLSLLEPWWNHSEIETPWGRAALDMLTDELAALLAEQPSSGFGAWPSAGFGVRRFDATHRPEPMYGQWDLQFGDNDGERRYAGRVRAGDPGGHVAALVADLRELGFTAPVDGTTRFDARVAMAVREFQIEANQVDLSIDRGGVQKVRSPRRYFGRVHGIVDGETRRLIQLWLNRPRVEGDPQPLGPSVDHARNGLLVIACVAQPGPDPLAARPVHPQGSDVWGAMGEPDQPPPGVAGVVQGDDFDFMFLHCRHWAIDRLSRWDPPVAEEPPILANFGPPVPFAGVDAVPLGRYTNAYIGGPSMAFFSRRDHWQSTLLTWNRFQDSPSPDLPPRPEDWRVLYGMTYPETFGYEDVINGYDPALLSIGWSHWTLATHRWEDDPPPLHREADVREMGAMLAWYRHRDPEGFHRDLGQFGLHTPAWGTAAVQFNGPGLHNGRILMWGAGDSNNRLNLVLPQEPDVTQWHLEHTWMRSWRWVYRFLQVARLSTSFRRANREFLLRRIITFLAAPYRGGGFAGEPPPSIGALACSEQAVIALMRWHINLPGYVIRRNGHPGARLREAVDAAANAYRKLPGVPELPDAHAIVVATLADPGNPRAVAFQEKLIEGLLSQTEPIPDPGEPHDPDHVCHPYEGDFGTVRACYAVHNPPAGVPIFRRLPGSYAPPPLPAAWA
ncbi:peptidoglycan-binding domain-containing protein [Nitrospira sp. CMX1]